MKVIYEVFIEDDDASLTRIELIFSELTALEKSENLVISKEGVKVELIFLKKVKGR